MAAQELDKNWNGWMKSLSESYEKTFFYLDKSESKKAAEDFSTKFVPTAKKMFSEISGTYPLRFNKSSNWCDWAQDFYKLSLKVSRTIESDPKKAEQHLETMRGHFYALHVNSKTESSADFIYAYRLETHKDAPGVENLNKIQAALKKAPLSIKAKLVSMEYEKEKTEWGDKTKSILEDGKIDANELTSLRDATQEFYTHFGMQFE